MKFENPLVNLKNAMVINLLAFCQVQDLVEKNMTTGQKCELFPEQVWWKG
jgi:hypothetical protein